MVNCYGWKLLVQLCCTCMGCYVKFITRRKSSQCPQYYTCGIKLLFWGNFTIPNKSLGRDSNDASIWKISSGGVSAWAHAVDLRTMTYHILHVGCMAGIEQLLHNLIVAFCCSKMKWTSSLLHDNNVALVTLWKPQILEAVREKKASKTHLSSNIDLALGDNQLVHYIMVAIPAGQVERSPAILALLSDINLSIHK